MKMSYVSGKLMISMIVVFLLIGCSGTFFYESLGSLLNCIFYGECDFYDDGYYYTQFKAGENNDGTVLQGKWIHTPSESPEYFELTFYPDRSLELVMYKKGIDYPVRSDRGFYIATDEKLTISMENGTKSVVEYTLNNSMLYLSLPSIN